MALMRPSQGRGKTRMPWMKPGAEEPAATATVSAKFTKRKPPGRGGSKKKGKKKGGY